MNGLPEMDFETYSEAGFLWDEAGQKWGCPKGATRKGIFAVGAAVYAEHPSTEVLSLAYDLKDTVALKCGFQACRHPRTFLASSGTAG